MDNLLLDHVKNMLSLAREIFTSNPTLFDETGSFDPKGDKTIVMDTKIESALVDYIKSNNIPTNIYSEEIGEIKHHKHPKYLITFDPLDGSINYKIGKNIFPYGTLIAVYRGTEPKLNDVIVSGVIEYSSDLLWYFSNGITYTENAKQIRLKTDWEITRSTPIFLDLYYKNGYELYRPIAEKLFIRNMGSTIGNLSYVLSNIAGGLGGVCMRPEEVGAIYSLIKGAGGIVVDHLGKDIGEKVLLPESTYEILAGSKNVIEFATKLLSQNLSS